MDTTLFRAKVTEGVKRGVKGSFLTGAREQFVMAMDTIYSLVSTFVDGGKAITV